MLTDEQVKSLYGQNIVYLFKGSAPFTTGENPKAPLGMLIANAEGKVACYECNGFFHNLAGHVVCHDMSSETYKKKYGFAKNTAICSKEFSRQRSLSTLAAIEAGTVIRPSYALASRRAPRSEKSMKAKNEADTCPEQYKERFRLLAARYGDGFTVDQAREADYTCLDAMNTMYGSFNKAKEALGLTVNTTFVKKGDADLIYALREYVKRDGQIPWMGKKKAPGFAYWSSTYGKHFGSMSKAYKISGVRRVSRGSWEVID